MASNASTSESNLDEQNEMHSFIKSSETTSSDAIRNDLSEERAASIMNAKNHSRDPNDDSDYLDRMPVEIVLNILENLGADDLGSSRLVNKRLGAIGRRLLCRSVNVMEATESFERLLTISNQDEEITGSVRHLNYIALGGEPSAPYPKDHYTMWLRLHERLTHDQITRAKSAEEIGSMYSTYKAFWADRKMLLQSPLMNSKFLEKAFRTLRPNSIVILHKHHEKLMLHKLYRRFYDCTPYVQRYWGRQTRPFVAVLLAAEATRLNIRKLTAAPSFAFLSHPLITKLEKTFESIEILDLVLLLNNEMVCPTDQESMGEGKVFIYNNHSKVQLARFFQKAQGLRKLVLMIVGFPWHPGPDFLIQGKLRWPRLASLTLDADRGRMPVDNLIEFILIHATTLKTLTLRNLWVEPVSSLVVAFKLLLQHVRDRILNLERLDMDYARRSVLRHKLPVLNKAKDEFWWPDLHWSSKRTNQTLSTVLGNYVDVVSAWVEMCARDEASQAVV